MKIRSLFLCTCMTVVPLTALLSHRLPGGVVQAAGGLVAAFRGGAESGQGAPPNALAEAATEEFAEVSPPASPAPASPATPQTPPENALAGRTPAADSPPPATTGTTLPDGGLLDIPGRLAAAGATSVECRPLPGTGGGFTASCRVGVDAGGSLFRMFQANGTDPSTASQALLEAVELWRERAPLR